MSQQHDTDPGSAQHTSPEQPGTPTRRNLLKGLGTLGGSLLAGGALASQTHAAAETAAGANTNTTANACPDTTLQSVPFYGKHQAGIITPEPAEAVFIAFDVVGKGREDLVKLFQDLTNIIAFLTKGGPAPTADVRLPPPESGILGAQVHPDNLTMTVTVGASLFDERFGLAAQKPVHLVEMPSFPNDALERPWCDGDVMIQICANTRETVIYAMRYVIKNFPNRMVARWKIDGFLPARDIRNRTTPVNLMGFKDGTGNPSHEDEQLMNEMVWVGKNSREPAWAEGGSYEVVRLIRFRLEFWDRTPLGQQQNDFGRLRATGAPHGKEHEFDDPDFESDLDGNITPLDSHMRRAEPRIPERHVAKLRRRSFSYSLGLTKARQLDMGLIFVCFQADLQTGFIQTQMRLNGEPLEEYIKPFGGGYYFALPGTTPDSYLGQALVEG